MSVANFVIAGTEKAGTTSVFSYLSQHPDVTPSLRKETDFFRHGGNLADYARCFPEGTATRIVMEASPSYLGEAHSVVPRMRRLIPDVRLLFILREPIARLLSSFEFHRSRLNLPQSLSFHDYVSCCLAHDGGTGRYDSVLRSGVAENIDRWHLDVLPRGRYATYLRSYFEAFPPYNIKVMFYDHLVADPVTFVEEISGFLEIDEAFWSTADLEPRNVTFFGRNERLHRLAILVNDRMEPILRARPRLKSAALGLYKAVNGKQTDRPTLSDHDRSVLEAYYAPSNRELERLLGQALPPGWTGASDRADSEVAEKSGGGASWLR
jgi:hypothetical protein